MFGFLKKQPKPEPSSPPDEPVQIKTFADRFEAEIVTGLLSARDIPSYIQAEDIGQTRPYMTGVTGGVRLFVRSDHAEKALRILSGYENQDPLSEQPFSESENQDGPTGDR